MWTAALMTGCVQAPVFQSDDEALLISNYPVVYLNGVEVESSYKLSIPAGDNTVLIVYHTYLIDYQCTFRWTAAPGSVYEVTGQENRFPLTIFRLVRSNALWASRFDPVDPEDCTQETRP
jgi:hypothetical protein